MPMWRCPHCGTPQAETARCWVCRRSSTACGTCRHFRRSVAAQLGYCGLDRHRLPLHGDEIRACWEVAAAAPEVPPTAVRPTPSFDAVRTPVRALEFVEVRSAGPAAGAAGTAAAPNTVAAGAVAAGAVAAPKPAAKVRLERTLPVVDPGVDGLAERRGEPIVAVRPIEPGWSLWTDAEL